MNWSLLLSETDADLVLWKLDLLSFGLAPPVFSSGGHVVDADEALESVDAIEAFDD